MAGAAGDPRLWVAVGLGSFLTMFLVLGFTFFVDEQLDRRDELAGSMPMLARRVAQSAEGDTGTVAARKWWEKQQEQAELAEAGLREAADRASPGSVVEKPKKQVTLAPPEPERSGFSAGALTPALASFACGGVVLLLGGLGAVLLLRGGPPPQEDVEA